MKSHENNPTVAEAATAETYYWWVADIDGKNTLTISNATDDVYEGTLDGNKGSFLSDFNYESDADVKWCGLRNKIQSVKVVGAVSPVLTKGWFCGFSKVTSIDLSGLDTSLVTDINHMFSGCSGLNSIDFGENFVTSSVENMSNMFEGCGNMTELNLSGFNNENVIKAAEMRIIGRAESCDKN